MADKRFGEPALETGHGWIFGFVLLAYTGGGYGISPKMRLPKFRLMLISHSKMINGIRGPDSGGEKLE